jgi:flagellar hook-length control protein FliK
MAQMVLPQAPATGAQKDSGPVKAGSGKETSHGESQYESVSRAEQKRMDRQRAERSEEARSSDKPDTEKASQSPDNSQNATDAPAHASAESKGSGSKHGDKSGRDPSDTTTADGVSVAPALTFADLQALLAPAGGQAAATADTSAVGKFSTPGVLTQAIPGMGLAGASAGQPGTPGQSMAGQTSGLKLTEALAGTLMQNERQGADPAALATPTRFHTALDMAAQQATRPTAEAAIPLKGYATSIDLPVNHADWGDKMAGKLSWLTARNMSVAEIHLTPPDMGPMEVKVKLHHDQAIITVHAANPVVRDQLELNSHRLRDMLADQGVSLAQFDVSDSPQQQGGETPGGEHQGSGGQGASETVAGGDTGEAGLSTGHLDLSWKGEVDIFA